MDQAERVASPHVGGTARRGATGAALLWAALLMGEAAAQTGDLFTPVAAGPADRRLSSIAPDPMAARRRLVTIDFGRLAPPDFALAPPADGTPADALSPDGTTPGRLLRLNLFDDAVFTGLVERMEPTFSGGHALSGRLVDVDGGTMTLVIDGDLIAGTVRTPDATYQIRSVGNGLHAVSQVDPARLRPLGEPVSDQPPDVSDQPPAADGTGVGQDRTEPPQR